MSSKNSNKINVPEARAAMDKFKMEAAAEVGVNLKEGYNGDLTSREAGSVGGQMVKKMIESYEKNLYRIPGAKERRHKPPLLLYYFSPPVPDAGPCRLRCCSASRSAKVKRSI